LGRQVGGRDVQGAPGAGAVDQPHLSVGHPVGARRVHVPMHEGIGLRARPGELSSRHGQEDQPHRGESPPADARCHLGVRDGPPRPHQQPAREPQLRQPGRPPPPGGAHERHEVADEPQGEQDGHTQQPRSHRRSSRRGSDAVVGHAGSVERYRPSAPDLEYRHRSDNNAHFLCGRNRPAVSLGLPARSRAETFPLEVTQPLMSTEQETASVEATEEAVDQTPETPAEETAAGGRRGGGARARGSEATPAESEETAEASSGSEEAEEAPAEASNEESTPEAPSESTEREPAGPKPIEAPKISELPDEIIDDFEAAVAHTVLEFDEGDIVVGTVVSVDADGAMVDIGYKSEGLIPTEELSIRNNVDPKEIVQVGDRVEALVLNKEDDEGRLILSKKRAQYERAWGRIQEIADRGETVKGTVIEVVKGGLIVDIGLRGFLPASLVDLR